jgi:hypothetical protein
MTIFRAAILDLSGEDVLIPVVIMHVVTEQDDRVEAAFQVTESVAELLGKRDMYRIAREDGRTHDSVIEQIQRQPDGTVTFVARFSPAPQD